MKEEAINLSVREHEIVKKILQELLQDDSEKIQSRRRRDGCMAMNQRIISHAKKYGIELDTSELTENYH